MNKESVQPDAGRPRPKPFLRPTPMNRAVEFVRNESQWNVGRVYFRDEIVPKRCRINILGIIDVFGVIVCQKARAEAADQREQSGARDQRARFVS